MGSGSWTTESYINYATSRGLSFDASTSRASLDSVQDYFGSKTIASELDPHDIMRECVETEEHPNTIPVILALDVTGSMGSAATETASALNVIMQDIMSKVNDVEFCVMGIGDLAYDRCPIQISQFESDIRIAEHLDKVFFEFGGGGNSYESYTAAWYMGARHTNLDCWKRGKKGIIITMGDENLNPYLPKEALERATGDNLQDDVETNALYDEVKEKYDVYHIFVEHGRGYYKDSAEKSFTAVIPKENYRCCSVNAIAETIADIVTRKENITSEDGISW